MAYGFKKGILNLFTWTLTLLAIVGVNSACNIVFGQPEEPKSLKRYKRKQNIVKFKISNEKRKQILI